MTPSAVARVNQPDAIPETSKGFDRADVESRGGIGLRAFFRLAECWGLTAEQQRTLLGRPAKTTFYRWRNGNPAAVTVDLMERLSHLLGIYGALHSLYLEHDRADSWIRRPNDAPLFNGREPIERLLGGRVVDLYEVRRYLEAIAEPGL